MVENNTVNHEVKIVDRNYISLSGINKIISFNDEEFLLDSVMGNIHIKGTNLEILKLDTTDGIVRIKGKINNYNYLDKQKKSNEESLISKLFK